MAQAVVTGATSGIGRGVAQALHNAGHQVVVLGRNPQALAELQALGMQARLVDLADVAGLDAALDGLAPDILVNNAGVMPPLGNFCDADFADIDHAITVNLRSVLALTHALAPGMRARGHGHIFFTGSTAGHAPFANLAVYSATKAAIGGFAQALRLDLAPHGVRVTEIVAGRVETGLYNALLPAEARAAMYAGNAAVQPADVAAMLLAVLALPQSVDVARFDILPTHQGVATGSVKKEA
ncbi:short-chain dehydrogenase [Cypionkella aquatica]|uniref:Short-chain dehydrogenase n=1 Tax=Cypionkella aquatica TaxID=1756042 RepID=A0AA37TR59_9RHOB|nr:SDR family oxidoreductase [Cypionkella aquatica]GLS86062.1 short-chain dehydrogenase [Cypionkella aquatica]